MAAVPRALGDEVGGFATELDTNWDRFTAGQSEAVVQFLVNIEFAWPEGFAGAGDEWMRLRVKRRLSLRTGSQR